MNLLADLLLKHLPDPLDVGALLADNDAWFRGVQRDIDLVRRPLKLDLGNAGALQFAARSGSGSQYPRAASSV